SAHGMIAPFPGWADAGYLGASPFLIAGALLLAGGRHGVGRARLLMDSAIVAGSLGVVNGCFLVRLLWQKSDLSPAARLIGAAAPLGDVAVLFVAFLLLNSTTIARERRR